MSAVLWAFLSGYDDGRMVIAGRSLARMRIGLDQMAKTKEKELLEMK